MLLTACKSPMLKLYSYDLMNGDFNQRVSYFCKRGNFVSNYVISSHTHSVSVLYNFSSATLCGTYTYFH